MRGREIVLALGVAGALLAAPAAHGATLSVDDDGLDCPAAPFTSIQSAVNAASAGDTVAICPGAYAEGTGAVGTSALTIAKSLTLRGAGAGMVRISPRQTTPGAGQIASGAANASLTDGVGDIVSVAGTPTAPVTVHISGVTIDGDGVYVEAGIVYRDAQGSIAGTHVTDIVTSEAANDPPLPGGWRADFAGYGIAHVTAATAQPAGAAPRTLVIVNTRVERYNEAGVVVEGLTDGATTLVDNRAVVSASEVVGRVLCQNFSVNGNCSAPGLVTTGPLFGQDGILASDRSRVSVSGSMVTQNLVNGTGAPVRQTFTNAGVPQNPGTAGNANLWLGAGIRLVGADAAGSLITRNNIVDNAYGVFNAEADGTTASAVAVPATDNWWGKRFTTLATNPGPAISPAYNPPVPENPVNGAPVADGAGTTSSAVDFFPYRSGPQSDPLTGQFPNIEAPSAVQDDAPSITLNAGPDTAIRGQAVMLSAIADDDFGVRKVTFYDGATPIGSLTRPPYVMAYTVPADAACASRALTAVAEDALGQTTSAAATVTVTGPDECRAAPPPPVPPPAASLPDGLNAILQGGTAVTVAATSGAGVAKVEFLLGTRLVCTVTAAPYSCLVVPRAGDVGLQSLRVVITDNAGGVTVLSRQVLIDRFRAAGVDIGVKQKRLKGNRERRTITARIELPAGVSAAEACGDGSVTFVVTRRGRAFLNEQVALRADCTARLRFTAKRARKPIHKVSARFADSTVLYPISSSRRFS